MFKPVMSRSGPDPVTCAKLFDEAQSLEVGTAKTRMKGLREHAEQRRLACL